METGVILKKEEAQFLRDIYVPLRETYFDAETENHIYKVRSINEIKIVQNIFSALVGINIQRYISTTDINGICSICGENECEVVEFNEGYATQGRLFARLNICFDCGAGTLRIFPKKGNERVIKYATTAMDLSLRRIDV